VLLLTAREPGSNELDCATVVVPAVGDVWVSVVPVTVNPNDHEPESPWESVTLPETL
jgi:hypothetical protein